MSDFIAEYDDTESKPLAKEELTKEQNKDETKEKIEVPMDESDVIEAEKKANSKEEGNDPIQEAARGQGRVHQEEGEGEHKKGRDAEGM